MVEKGRDGERECGEEIIGKRDNVVENEIEGDRMRERERERG